MATIDGLLVGFIVGALGTAGVWAFVESESGSSPYVPAIRDAVRQTPQADVAVTQPEAPRVPDVEAPVTPSRRSPRARATRAAAPLQLEATADGVLMPDDVGGAGRLEDPEPIDRPEPRTTRADTWRPRLGVALGSGAELALARGLGTGVQWDVRLLAEPYEHLGLELGYIGTTGSDNNSSSVEVLAKWSPQSKRPIRYYALAGVGWRRCHREDLDVAAVPLGIGVARHRGNWRADTRLTLRAATRSGFHTLGITAHVGRAF